MTDEMHNPETETDTAGMARRAFLHRAGIGSAIATGATIAEAMAAESTPPTTLDAPAAVRGAGGKGGCSRDTPNQFGQPGVGGRVLVTWLP